MEATTAPEQIRRWWRRWPTSKISVLLDGLDVVVLDPDGDAGEESLSRVLQETGVVLPETYEERTGRSGGGRHLFFRLPTDAPSLVTQYGTENSWHPDLDVLFRNIVIVAGSLHHSGAFYSTEAERLPSPGDLAVLPVPIYDLLASRGRPYGDTAARQERPRAEKPSPSPNRSSAAGGGRAVPRSVARMLADTSDGRNARVFDVVVALLNRGWPHGEIITTVLGSPLGDKAREADPSHPARWVQQKIDPWTDQGHDAGFDADAYWCASHTAGLPSHHLRILDSLLGEAWCHWGRVSRSFGRIGIGSAMSDPRDHMHALEEQGWLTTVEKWTSPRGPDTVVMRPGVMLAVRSGGDGVPIPAGR